MRKRMDSITGGRWTLWWLKHGREFKYYLALLAVFALYCYASKMDYEDALNAEKARADAEQSRAQECLHPEMLPSTVFIIEARSSAAAAVKLADIAAASDRMRLGLGRK